MQLTSTRHGQLVLVGEFIDAENGDDVLEVFVTLENALYATSNAVVFLTDNLRVEQAAGGAEKVRMSILSVRNLSKAFGGVHAVDDVSFDVGEGEFLALIGPNGAGKSTCFNMINGQLAPDHGDIEFADRSIVGLKPREVWRLGVGRTFQVAATFGSMTVAENVQMALISYAREIFRPFVAAGQRHRERAIELLAQVGMATFQNRGQEPQLILFAECRHYGVDLTTALADRQSRGFVSN